LCCINYNLILAQRQFGYLIRGSSTAASLTTLLTYHGEGDVTGTLLHIRSSWKKVILMEKDSRALGIDREIPYHQWVTERVNQVKLPFQRIPTQLRNEEQNHDIQLGEVKKLKEEVARLKEKNVKMTDDLLGLQHSFAYLNREYEEKTEAYEGLVKKQRAKRDYAYRIKQDLSAANKELTMRVQERNTALLAER